MPSIEQLAPGTSFAKDFRIERILGIGGMGAVYEATLVDTKQRVALKLMHPGQLSDPKLRQRFAQEARVGAWIGSPHIVDVLRAGVDETGVPWIAMEFLQGQTLASKLQRYLPTQGLPHDEAWLILAQLCRGLIAAHDKGIVHRDLKPENIFITSSPRVDAPFTVKILDFGIAKRLNPTAPSSNRTTAIGTPLWMSPEQNEVSEITPAADVWAVGLLCFRMFTGRFYWLSANEPELNLGWLYHELITEPLVSASTRAEMLGCELLLPPKFDTFFSRCVTRDPKQRFANAREMSEALAAIAPPYFKPFVLTPTLPPDAASTTSWGSSAAPVSSLAAPTLVAAAPALPPSALPGPMPPPSGKPSSQFFLVVAGALLVLVASAVVLFATRARPTPSTPSSATPQAPPLPPHDLRPGSVSLPGSPGPIPLDPSLLRKVK